MATPPFTIDEASPASTNLISAFPADENAFRDTVESWLTTFSNASDGLLKPGGFPSSLALTGKTITAVTLSSLGAALAIADGGTGATSAAAAFSALKQAATTSATGVVEKSTSAENVAGTSDTVYPSVAGVKEMIDTHAGASGDEAFEFIIDGGEAVITTGIKGDIEVPYACTIDRVTLLADQTGSIVVDIWKDTYANYPPTDADSITASAVPTISAAVKSQDTSLTGWTTSLAAGDILRYNVDSASTVTRVLVSLKVTKT